jgi:peptidoglycan/xylan/chitin deacetylase (PgdA/CDA1 family)
MIARLAGLALTVQAAPALTSLAPIRRFTPRLAGLGDPAHVALTFDDGPDRRSTPAFLDALDSLGVQATFFLLGRMLERDPGLGRELAAAGHELAVHGWAHRPTLIRAGMHADLRRTKDLISSATGTVPRWYRPPYGVLTASALLAARRHDLTPVLWTTWARDWTASATPESILRTLTIEPGSTILLHDSDCTSAPDSWKATLQALPAIVARTRARGLTLGPLRDHGLMRQDREP